jgi:hypothetical protein
MSWCCQGVGKGHNVHLTRKFEAYLFCMQVAACVCLFSLDKHAAIPVDTHVWQLASRYYTPHLKGPQALLA